jgi:hypothetical protein
LFADAHAPSCPADLSGKGHSKTPGLGELFDEMPSIPHVPVAEAPSITVQGRLREHSDYWLTELEASDFVRGIVQHGYRIPFLARPPPVFHFNHQSALQNEKFVSS